jgi:RimJ/RimL family protein N-acetyltransferase
LKQSKSPTIITKRLVLSSLEDSDVDEIFFLRSDPGVNRFVKRPAPKNKKEALAVIQKLRTGVAEGESFFWRFSLKGGSRLIGTICLWNFSEDRKTAEIGYDLHPNLQGKGYMNEAFVSVLNYGFTQLSLTNIEAYTHFKNRRSLNLLRHNGFKHIEERKDETNADNIVYSLSNEGRRLEAVR